jgi:hypothetical protein
MGVDRAARGAGLMVLSVAALGGWMFTELVLGSRGHGGGGGGAIEIPAPAAPAEPVVAVEPPPPEVIVVERHRSRGRDPFSRGWVLDPADGYQKLYQPDGTFVGGFDFTGQVWNRSGSRVGGVATGPSCLLPCQRSQARKILLGEDLAR